MGIFIFTIFYFLLSWLRLDYAVMFLIFALPSYQIRFSLFGLPSNLLEAMVLIAFAVWLVKKTELLNYLFKPSRIERFKNNKIARIPYPFGWEIILLLVISFIAVVVAGFSDSALGIWKAYFFEPVLAFILVLNVFKNNANGMRMMRINGLEKIIWPLALSTFILSAFAIYQKITGQFIFNPTWAEIGSRRATSLFSYPNALGLYLGPIVLLLVGWITSVIASFALAKRGNLKKLEEKETDTRLLRRFTPRNDIIKIIFLVIIIILSLTAIYFAKSEGALIGIIGALFLFGLLAGKRIRWVTIILAIILSAGIFTYQPTRDYAIKKITLQDLSGEIRKQQWQETWQMLADGRIISGSGLASYQTAIEPYHQEGIFFNSDNDPEFHRHVVWNEEYKKAHWQPVEIYLYPHNILLNFWAELGLAGMLLFIWIIGKYFWISISNFQFPISKQIQNSKFKIQNYTDIGLIGAMIVIVIHGIVDVPYFKNDLAIIFWLLVAMTSLMNTNIRMDANDANDANMQIDTNNANNANNTNLI
jgi:O-antigen ligase